MNNVFKWILISLSTIVVFYYSYIGISQIHFPLGEARLKLLVQCSVDSKFKIYYAKSSEFVSKKMLEKDLKGNADFQSLDFALPPSFNADNFRFQVGNNEDTPIKIKLIQLKSAKTYQWDPHQIFDEFKPYQMIQSYTLKNNYVEIVANGETPLIQNTHNLNPIIEGTIQNTWNKYKPISYAIIISIFFYSMMYYILFYTLIPLKNA